MNYKFVPVSIDIHTRNTNKLINASPVHFGHYTHVCALSILNKLIPTDEHEQIALAIHISAEINPEKLGKRFQNCLQSTNAVT